MLTLRRPQSPAPAEEQTFERFAVDVRTVATALAHSRRIAADGGSELDLRDPRQAEFGILGLSTAAKQHLMRRGEDLLTLVERLTAMIDADRSGGPGRTCFEASLHLVCAVAMAEFLQEEAARYRRDVRLREVADSTMARLADGFVICFGSRLPDEVARAFPRFALGVRHWASVRRLNAQGILSAHRYCGPATRSRCISDPIQSAGPASRSEEKRATR